MIRKQKSFFALCLAIFSLFYLIGISSLSTINAGDDHHDDDDYKCGYNCPVIHWTWTTSECPSSNSAYTSSNDHLPCSRRINNHNRYANKVDVNHSADVAYLKSNDDDHDCDRPSDNTLEHTYGMNQSTRSNFKNHNSEHKNGIPKSCPSNTPTVIASSTPTNTPTVIVDNTSTPTAIPTGNESTPTQSPEPTGNDITATPVPTSTNAPNNDSNNNNSSSGNSAPTCNDQDPGAPQNLKAFALGGGKVKLTWDNPSGPFTSFAVAYGPSVGNYLYGDPNVGKVNSYTVQALNPGGNYCFYVQAQNGCRGGSPSNVVCTNQPGTVRVLGITDNQNPLVDGLRQSFGGMVLGDSTELMATAEVNYSQDKLPSGNKLIEGDSISIPSVNVNQPVYEPQVFGDVLTVGSHEVLTATIKDTQVYYGHNASDVFGSLYKIKNGDKVSLVRGGQTINYQVVSKEFVSKYDVDAVKVSNPSDIVLVTCSYTHPNSRILVKASIIK